VNNGLTSGQSITADSRGIGAIGEAAQGRVAYSVNGGQSFVATPAVQDWGNIHTVIDARFIGSIAIYAASDATSGSIYTGGATGWKSLEPPNRGFYGLASIGTLYGLWNSAGSSGANRALYPEEILSEPAVEWDVLTAGLTPGVLFTREPSALKASEYGYLWAIDNRPYTASTGRLWIYCDCMTPVYPIPQTTQYTHSQLFGSPVPSTPSQNQVITFDPASGEIDDIKFTWQHETQAKEYELLLGTDHNFTAESTKSYTLIVPGRTSTPSVLLPSKKEGIQAETPYFWKVRGIVAENNESESGLWSQTMSFIIKPQETQPSTPSAFPAPTLLTPANGSFTTDRAPLFSWSSLKNAALYEITVSTNNTFSQLVLQETVESSSYRPAMKLVPNTEYYWQVKVVAPILGQSSSTYSFSVTSEEKDKADAKPQDGMVIDPWIMWIILPVIFIGIILLTIFVIKHYRKPR